MTSSTFNPRLKKEQGKYDTLQYSKSLPKLNPVRELKTSKKELHNADTKRSNDEAL
jgi:hypothetical protein